MYKIKIYGTFIALVYSLFFNIMSYNNSHIPEDEAASKSQVRVSFHTEEERVILPLRSVWERESSTSNNNSSTEPLLSFTKVRERSVGVKKNTYNEIIYSFKSLATERYRVLRN